MYRVDVTGEKATNGTFTIDPELKIGTELWALINGKARVVLVAGYQVWVTAHKEEEGHGLYNQIFGRWLNRKQKEYWNYCYEYTVKIDGDFCNNFPNKIGGNWYIHDKRLFFSKEELLKSL